MAARHPTTGHMLSCLCPRCGERVETPETQPDDLREETERHLLRLETLAKHLPGSADFGPATPFVKAAVAHLRRLQQRNELLAAELAESKAALERVAAIESALAWAVKVGVSLVDDRWWTDCPMGADARFDGTGPSIADALIELAKRGGGT